MALPDDAAPTSDQGTQLAQESFHGMKDPGVRLESGRHDRPDRPGLVRTESAPEPNQPVRSCSTNGSGFDRPSHRKATGSTASRCKGACSSRSLPMRRRTIPDSGSFGHQAARLLPGNRALRSPAATPRGWRGIDGCAAGDGERHRDGQRWRRTDADGADGARSTSDCPEDRARGRGSISLSSSQAAGQARHPPWRSRDRPVAEHPRAPHARAGPTVVRPVPAIGIAV